MKLRIIVAALLAKLASSYTLFDKEPRIVGGTEAEESRYPYMVALVDIFDGNLTCGGSLIAPDTILTAAHCFYGYEDIYRFAITAVIGRHDLDSDLGEKAVVDRVIAHPNYDNTTYVNDVGLIFLSEPTSLVSEFALLNNDESVPAPGDVARTMGWGDTTQDSQSIIPSDILMVTDLPIMSNEECITLIESFYESVDDLVALIWDILGTVPPDYESNSMICTLEPGQDACQGDSGGPLIIPGSSADQDVLIGVVSWGLGCGDNSQPGVFSRVSEAFDWISTTVCSGSIDPPVDLCGVTDTPEPSLKLTKEPTQEPTNEPMNAFLPEGPEVVESRYPYMVALVDRLDGNLTCGGSLIAQDTILTAARCVYGIEDIYSLFFSAVIGSQDLDLPLGEEVLVERVIAHPNYDNTTYVNDFALIFLSQPTSLVTEFALLNKDESVPAPGDVALTIRWGDMTQDVQSQTPSDLLTETDLPVMSNEGCTELIESYYESVDDLLVLVWDILGTVALDYDSSSMICTLEPSQDDCLGDLGSPLIIPGSSADQDVLIGFVSWNLACGDSSLPRVFSRVSGGFDWISTTVCSGSIGPPDYLCDVVPDTPEPSLKLTEEPTQEPTNPPMVESTPEPSLKLTKEPSSGPSITSTPEPSLPLANEPAQGPTTELTDTSPTLPPMNTFLLEGTEAEESRYPYMVALVDIFDGNLFCGGSLIAPDTILTAAHCFYGYEDIYRLGITAVIGRHDLDSDLGEKAVIDRVIAHPNYDNTTYVNDIGLIFLSEPTGLVSEFVLLNNDESVPAPGDVARTMGWENTTQDAQSQIPSDKLMVTDLPIMSNEECTELIESYYESVDDVVILVGDILGTVLPDYESNNMICTLEPRKDDCMGDLGSPLILPDSSADQDVLIGFVSWNLACGDSSLPRVFSRVSGGFDWISTTTCSGSIDPPDYLCNNVPSPEPSLKLTEKPTQGPTNKAMVESTTEPSLQLMKVPSNGPSIQSILKPTLQLTIEPSQGPTSESTSASPTLPPSTKTPETSLTAMLSPTSEQPKVSPTLAPSTLSLAIAPSNFPSLSIAPMITHEPALNTMISTPGISAPVDSLLSGLTLDDVESTISPSGNPTKSDAVSNGGFECNTLMIGGVVNGILSVWMSMVW